MITPKTVNWVASLTATLSLLFFAFTTAISQPTGCPTCDPDNNLIWYGDFSISSTTLPVPASTSLNPLCTCNYSPGNPGYGSYCIETDAYNKCTSFDHVLDHTNPGVSRYMVVDGFPNGDIHTLADPNIVWKDEVFIATPGTYDFSFWVMPNLSNSTNVTPVFNFRVDYAPVVTNIGTSPTLNQWNEYCMQVVITDPGMHVLEIAQTNNGGGSNDYGIDDIFFGQCCECEVNADFTYNQTSPNPFEVNFTSNSTFSSCTTPYWYEWHFGDGNSIDGPSLSGVSHTYPGPGWYNVCLVVYGIDGNRVECMGEFCTEVYVRPEEGECMVNADFTVNGNLTQTFLTNFSTVSTTIDQWTYTIYDPYLGTPYSITSSTVGGDAATSPGWNGQFTPSGPGGYLICLTVYDYDIPDCYSTICHEVEITNDGNDVPCDAVPSFNFAMIGAPATYQFTNTSTASSPMLFNWNIIDMNGGPGASYPGQQDITHTFINAHTYQVCLTVTQLFTPLGQECTFTHCETITIDEVSDHLNFTLGYTCRDIPELYINFLSTSDTQVDVSTTCSGGSTPINNGLYSIPFAAPLAVAVQPPYGWSSCWVTVTTQNLSPNISATQYMYFNCQPCPGTPGFDEGDPNAFQPEPSGELGVSVFPNPSAPGELQVRLAELSGPSILQVVDIEGKVIQTFNIDVEYSYLRMPLNTSDLSAGMYFLRLQSADEVTVEKFVIK